MFELFFWVLIGCMLGLLTGLVPGVHVNLLSLIVLFFAKSRLEFVLLIVAMSIVHSFLDFIPSILLGAPNEENFLSVLPGHRYLLRGCGLKAIKLTVFGGVIAGIFGLLTMPIFLVFVERIFDFLTETILYVLVGVLFLTVFSENEIQKKCIAIVVIVLSGILGVLLLNNSVIRMPLFVSITGFFALSSLIYSIIQNECIVKQEVREEKFSSEDVFAGSFLGLIAGSTVSLIPGIGASQAAFLVRELIGKIRTEKYLVILGAINTVNLMFSFFVLYAIGKTRTGPAAIVKQIFSIQESHLVLMAGVMLFAIAFGAIASLLIGKFLVKRIHLIPYRSINVMILIFLIVLGFALSGAIGLFVMFVCGVIGLLAISTRVKRTHCMGFLVIPTIIHYAMR